MKKFENWGTPPEASTPLMGPSQNIDKFVVVTKE